MNNNIAIVGYGRFGKLMADWLSSDHRVYIVHYRSLIDLDDKYKQISISDAIDICDTIIYTVPISSFEENIISHQNFYNHTKNPKVIIDCLSVKVHPQKVLDKYILQDGHTIIYSHPMFGPDSIQANNGFQNLPIVLRSKKLQSDGYIYWKKFFQKEGLKIVEITPQEHDQLAARSQGVTHFVGRVLESFGLSATQIDTLGAQTLQKIMNNTCNDSVELFLGLQYYNPYTSDMRDSILSSVYEIDKQIISYSLNKKYKYPTYGIQGGKGSFNEQVILEYIHKNNITNYELKYLFTTNNVLQAIQNGDVEYGLFALHNRAGGSVDESIDAMSQYNFKIIEKIDIMIEHFLMICRGSNIDKVTHIIAHPQVFLQCRDNLKKCYPNLIQEIGQKDLIDTARAAQALYEGDLGDHYAILGPKILANIYDLDIITNTGLQDRIDNITTFLLVKYR